MVVRGGGGRSIFLSGDQVGINGISGDQGGSMGIEGALINDWALYQPLRATN